MSLVLKELISLKRLNVITSIKKKLTVAYEHLFHEGSIQLLHSMDNDN